MITVYLKTRYFKITCRNSSKQSGDKRVAGSSPASGSKNYLEVLIMALLGGWNIDEMKTVNLPQKAQSAFTAVTGGLGRLAGSQRRELLHTCQADNNHGDT